jgi:hypothetical protein
MSSKQTARKRSASERAPLERRNEPAPLCSFAGTTVTPVAHAVGMRGDCARRSSACRRQVRPWSRMQAPASRLPAFTALHDPSGYGTSGHVFGRCANASKAPTWRAETTHHLSEALA